MFSILIIDDNETIRAGIAAVLGKLGHKTYQADNGADGLKEFCARHIDFCVVDLKMEGMDGIEVLRAILDKDADAVVMLITAFGTVETAVRAMKLGAYDFLTKPFKPELLRQKTEQALAMAKIKRERTRLRAENQLLRDQVRDQAGFASMVGSSPAMKQIFTAIEKVAAADSAVLITGESGTGKELVAQALHDKSRRAEAPFIRVNCGALAETLLESEIFGHEKGAFTGAVRRKLGRFELADTGTLFLDEIGEVSPGLQSKLLRVLQEKEIERVGGEATLPVDVRVIAATNQDLEARMAEGLFREDLFYRLHIVPIALPPLRERGDDILELARYFLHKLEKRTAKRLAGISEEALRAFMAYHWPGNVRELENVIEQAMVFAETDQIELADLPSRLHSSKAATAGIKKDPDGGLHIPSSGASLTQVLETVERRLILQAFESAGKIKTETARRLGIKTSALYYKLEKYEIE